MTDALLATLLPIRDHRDRIVAHHLASCPAHGRFGEEWSDDEARQSLDLIAPLGRLAGGTLVVPVPPTLVRDGSLTRFASADVVWLIATASIEEPATRRTIERLVGTGFRFALDGAPEGAPLPAAVAGAPINIDANRLPAAAFASRAQLYLEAGLRPIARGVDDRATRRRVLACGVGLYMGLPLVRGARTPIDTQAEASALRTLRTLAEFADGRPPDTRLDAFVEEDAPLSAMLLRSLRSASIAVRGPRSVAQAMTVLGRDAVLDRLFGAVARLLGEAVHDPELAFVAARRARTCERIGGALDSAPHPRARVLAGLLSMLHAATGRPPMALADELALPPFLSDVLTDRAQPLGRLVGAIEAHEQAWWPDLRSRCADLDIAPAVVSEAYFAAWRVAREDLGPYRTEPS